MKNQTKNCEHRRWAIAQRSEQDKLLGEWLLLQTVHSTERTASLERSDHKRSEWMAP